MLKSDGRQDMLSSERVLGKVDVRDAQVEQRADKVGMKRECAVVVSDSLVGAAAIGQSRAEAIV